MLSQTFVVTGFTICFYTLAKTIIAFIKHLDKQDELNDLRDNTIPSSYFYLKQIKLCPDCECVFSYQQFQSCPSCGSTNSLYVDSTLKPKEALQ